MVNAGESAKYEIVVRIPARCRAPDLKITGTIPGDCKPAMKTDGGSDLPRFDCVATDAAGTGRSAVIPLRDQGEHDWSPCGSGECQRRLRFDELVRNSQPVFCRHRAVLSVGN